MFAETPGSELDRLLPADFLPWFIDAVANHGPGDTVLVTGIPKGKSPFYTGMTFIGFAVFVRRHTHHFIGACFHLESTTNTTIGTGGDDRMFGLAVIDHRFFHQGRGRTGLHTGATRHAFGIEEILADTSRHLGLETATFDRQRECALDLIAGAHAT